MADIPADEWLEGEHRERTSVRSEHTGNGFEEAPPMGPPTELDAEDVLLLSMDELKARFNGKPETRKRKVIFIEHYQRHGLKGHCARLTGVSHDAVLEWGKRDPYFKRAELLAHELSIDEAELEARKRGIEGEEELVINRGEVVYRRDPSDPTKYLLGEDGKPVPLTRRVKSDRLLELVLQGRRSEVYGKKSGDVNVAVQQAPSVAAGLDFKTISPEKRELIRQLLEMPDEALVGKVALPKEEDPLADAF